MNERVIVIAAAALALSSGGSAMLPAQAQNHPSPAPTSGAHRADCRYGAGRPDTTARTISANVDPATSAQIDRAIGAYNCAGTGLTLRRAGSGEITITKVENVPGLAVGVTHSACRGHWTPCRPFRARIEVENGLDPVALPQTVVHEIGHAVGLEHTARGCAAMSPEVRTDEPCARQLARAPLLASDIAALRALWRPRRARQPEGR